MGPITDFLSEIRLGQFGNIEDSETLEKYLYNIRLCESMYPIIRIFESVLRNKTDMVLSLYMGQKWIFDFIDDERLLKSPKIRENRYNLVNELPLFFWCQLFQSNYNNRIWHKYPNALHDIFEYCNRRARLSRVPFEIDQIRKYRNRISHNGVIIAPFELQIPCWAIHGIICRQMKEIGAKSVMKNLTLIDRYVQVADEGKKRGFISCPESGDISGEMGCDNIESYIESDGL